MKKINVMILGASLTSMISFAAGPVGAKEAPRPREGREGKPSELLPGAKVEAPKTKEALEKEKGKDLVVPKAGAGIEAPPVIGRPGTVRDNKAPVGFSGANSSVNLHDTTSAPLRKVPSRPTAVVDAKKDATNFTSEFVDSLKAIKTENVTGEPVEVVDSISKETAKDAAEIMKVTKSGEKGINEKSSGSVTVIEKKSKDYNGAMEETIQKFSEGDKEIEGLLRLFVRRHAKANSESKNQSANIEELKASLAQFANIAKKAKELLGEDSPLAKHMMRNLLTHFVRSPKEAAEFAKSVDSWLNSTTMSKEQKAETIKGLAITIDTHGSEFTTLFTEGKSFEVAMAAADKKLAEMLEGKLSKEEIEQLAKECVPGATMRLAAANCAKLMLRH